jgi:hypothetical protein
MSSASWQRGFERVWEDIAAAEVLEAQMKFARPPALGVINLRAPPWQLGCTPVPDHLSELHVLQCRRLEVYPARRVADVLSDRVELDPPDQDQALRWDQQTGDAGMIGARDCVSTRTVLSRPTPDPSNAR